jgi:hypothetical protein
MALFSLTAQRLGLVFNYFLMTLLALLGMMGLKTVSFSTARNLIRETLTSSTGS